MGDSENRSKPRCGVHSVKRLGTKGLALSVVAEIVLLAVLLVLCAPAISQQITSWIGSLFSQSANHESAGYSPSILAAIIAAIASIIVGWPIAIRIAHRKAWKQYEYDRSEYVTRQVFDKEFADIQNMSEALYRLVSVTVECLENEHRGPRLEFDNARKEVEKLLSRTALSLYFTDVRGCPYCGVEKAPTTTRDDSGQEECPALHGTAANEGNNSGNGIPSKLKFLTQMHEKNLHDRAAELYLLCVCAEKNRFNKERMLQFCKQGEEKKCPAAMHCKESGPAEYLRCRYVRFLNCARCRLRANEMGGKDTRRKNFYGSLPMHQLVSRIAKHFNNECAFDGLDGQVLEDGGIYLVDTRGVFPKLERTDGSQPENTTADNQ